jgi:hypothetical protein
MEVPPATGRTADMPGETRTATSAVLASDVLQSVMFFDSLQDASCQSRRLIDTRIVKEDKAYVFQNGRLVDGKWSEVWTLDRCGKAVEVRLDFEADGRGGTTFGVSMV